MTETKATYHTKRLADLLPASRWQPGQRLRMRRCPELLGTFVKPVAWTVDRVLVRRDGGGIIESARLSEWEAT
jgi:hypothetical protein